MEDIKILEQILIEKGEIVNHRELGRYFENYSNTNNKIHSLVKKGRLVILKRGLYFITKLGSSGYTSISNYLIANLIGEESFVSFEAALQFYSLFDQDIKKYRSISLKQYLEKSLEGATYRYIKVNKSSYFGYDSKAVDGGVANIALKERALLDMIEYQRTVSSASVVLETLSKYYKDFDQDLLLEYLANFSKVTIKTLGLFYDWLGKDSTYIGKLLEGDKSVSKLAESSSVYNKKWRLYYDSVLKDQL